MYVCKGLYYYCCCSSSVEAAKVFVRVPINNRCMQEALFLCLSTISHTHRIHTGIKKATRGVVREDYSQYEHIRWGTIVVSHIEERVSWIRVNEKLLFWDYSWHFLANGRSSGFSIVVICICSIQENNSTSLVECLINRMDPPNLVTQVTSWDFNFLS